MLDLTPFYNAGLNESWHGNKGNDLAALPEGVQTFGGVEFDVRGIVQLGSKSPSSTNYPALIKGIPVKQKCQRLHFLHAAGFGNPGDEGKQIGAYVVHFTANPMRLEIPIRYGHEVRDWHALAGEPAAPDELTVVWTGTERAEQSGGPLHPVVPDHLDESGPGAWKLKASITSPPWRGPRRSLLPSAWNNF